MKRTKTTTKPGKKKFILCLIEGYTDSLVLRTPLRQLLETKTGTGKDLELQFLLRKETGSFAGDITSANGATSETICGLICKTFLDPFFDSYPYINLGDIHEIIQIIDMDGAFIPDNAVFSSDVEKPKYMDDGIYTNNVPSIIARNDRKRQNVLKLVDTQKILVTRKGRAKQHFVDYSVYFFSSNMDHFIYGKANLTSDEKTRYAREFASKTSNDTSAFFSLITDDESSCRGMTYEESWKYVQEGYNSIHRRSNLNILMEKHKLADV